MTRYLPHAVGCHAMLRSEKHGEVGEVGIAKHVGYILGGNIIAGEYLIGHLKAKCLHPAVWRHVKATTEVTLEGR